jgi:hypothetical protein
VLHGPTHIQCHKNPERPAEVNDLGGASVKGFNDHRPRPVNDGQSALILEIACSPPPTTHALKNPRWPAA